MKLYTEEELRKHLYNHSDEFFEQLTPIEFPSYDDIKYESMKHYDNNCANYYFELGAKWMRDKIQGGNNEQR